MIRTRRFVSNFMTSQPIVVHILPNISKSKDNQIMKFGPLIKYNMRNIFLQNHTQNVAEKVVSGPFLEIKISEHICGSRL